MNKQIYAKQLQIEGKTIQINATEMGVKTLESRLMGKKLEIKGKICENNNNDTSGCFNKKPTLETLNRDYEKILRRKDELSMILELLRNDLKELEEDLSILKNFYKNSNDLSCCS
jgi:hypothetical protein